MSEKKGSEKSEKSEKKAQAPKTEKKAEPKKDAPKTEKKAQPKKDQGTKKPEPKKEQPTKTEKPKKAKEEKKEFKIKHVLAIGAKRGHKVTKRKLGERPSRRKGVSSIFNLFLNFFA